MDPDRESLGREVERKQPPGQAIVAVVDQSRLGGGGERTLPEARQGEDLAGAQTPGATDVAECLQLGVFAGLSHEEARQPQPESGVGQAEEEGPGRSPHS